MRYKNSAAFWAAIAIAVKGKTVEEEAKILVKEIPAHVSEMAKFVKERNKTLMAQWAALVMGINSLIEHKDNRYDYDEWESVYEEVYYQIRLVVDKHFPNPIPLIDSICSTDLSECFVGVVTDILYLEYRLEMREAGDNFHEVLEVAIDDYGFYQLESNHPSFWASFAKDWINQIKVEEQGARSQLTLF